MKKLSFSVMLLLFVLVAGCTAKDDTPPEEDANLVASEKSFPSKFEDRSAEQEPRGFLAEVASTEAAYKDAWKDFELEGEMPDVDLKKRDVLFIGMYESGSCAKEIDEMEMDSDGEQLILRFSPLDKACTADLTPRNFVIEVDKDVSEKLKSVLLSDEAQDVDVPIQQMTVEAK